MLPNEPSATPAPQVHDLVVALVRALAPPAPQAEAPPPAPRKLLTFPEVADILHVNEDVAREWGNAGRFKVVRMAPKCVRVDPADLEDFIRRRKVG